MHRALPPLFFFFGLLTLPTPTQASPTPVQNDPSQFLAAWVCSSPHNKTPSLVVSDSIRATCDTTTPSTARALLRVHQKGTYQLHAGLPQGSRLYLNDRELQRTTQNEAIPDARNFTVHLPPGTHKVRVELSKPSPRWPGPGFYLRALDNTGKPSPHLSYALPPWKNARGLALQTRYLHQKNKLHLETTLRTGPSLPQTWKNARTKPLECPLEPENLCTRTIPLPPRHPTHPTSWEEPGQKTRVAFLRTKTPTISPQKHIHALLKNTQEALSSTIQTSPEALQLAWIAQHARDQLEGRPSTLQLSPKELQNLWKSSLQRVETRQKLRTNRLHWRSYRSSLDHRLQPYVAAYTPPQKHNNKVPLVVGLHGHRGNPMRMCNAMLGKTTLKALSQRFPDGFALACPYGYGDTAFRYAGEEDLFGVLREMQSSFPIDPDQIHLVGLSDGGLAAFEAGLHHPDVWASVVAMASVGDMRAFPPLANAQTADQKAWLNRVSALERAENAHKMHWMVAYGGKDRLPPSHAEAMTRKLRKNGAEVDLRIHKDLGHNVWNRTFAQGDLFAWLFQRKRSPSHRTRRYKTWSPRYRGAHGLEILSAQWPKGPSLHVHHPRPHKIKITTRHIARASLSLPPSTHTKTLQVTIDGQTTTLAIPPQTRSLLIQRQNKIWNATATPSPTRSRRWPLQKDRDMLSGPLDQIRTLPQAWIYDDHNTHQTALYKHLAEMDRQRWTRGILMDNQLGPKSALKIKKGFQKIKTGEEEGCASLSKDTEEGARVWCPPSEQEDTPTFYYTGNTARAIAWAVFGAEIVGQRAAVHDLSDAVPPFSLIQQ